MIQNNLLLLVIYLLVNFTLDIGISLLKGFKFSKSHAVYALLLSFIPMWLVLLIVSLIDKLNSNK